MAGRPAAMCILVVGEEYPVASDVAIADGPDARSVTCVEKLVDGAAR